MYNNEMNEEVRRAIGVGQIIWGFIGIGVMIWFIWKIDQIEKNTRKEGKY